MKTALIDVDGVLSNYINSYQTAYKLCGGDSTVTHDQIVTWKTEESIPRGIELHDRVETEFVQKPGFAYQMEEYPGAVSAVRRLCEIADVVFVTSPYENAPTWCHDRTSWLLERFPIERDQIIFAKQKYRVHGDILVDDKLSNCAQWAEKHPKGKAFVWARKYNASSPLFREHTLYRTDSWEVITRAVLA